MKESPRTKNRFFIEPKANWLVVTAPKKLMQSITW
jgi:hypothetical protein